MNAIEQSIPISLQDNVLNMTGKHHFAAVCGLWTTQVISPWWVQKKELHNQ